LSYSAWKIWDIESGAEMLYGEDGIANGVDINKVDSPPRTDEVSNEIKIDADIKDEY
jgi:AGCS family alanine or glycine:cation symporter